MACLKLKVKQGEEINVSFTIKQDGDPMDLDGYSIKFQVKEVPLEKVRPIINKEITTSSNPLVDGRITDESNGKFYVHLTKEDTSFNTGEHSLIISLIAPNMEDIISSNYCNGAKYIICEQ